MRKRQFITLIILLCFQFSKAQSSYAVFPIGFYNLENLFDTIDDEDVSDTEFTPDGEKAWTIEKYNKKLQNMASVIAKLGTDMNPEGLCFLGVSEIENRGVLEDLVKENEISSRNYQIVQYDSPDKRGVDVALLYNPSLFTLISSQARELLIEDEEGKRKYTRDVLHVSGTIDGEIVHVLVNHWPSRSGGEKKSAPGRAAAASLNMKIISEIQEAEPNAKIIVMGDLNDDPSSKSVKQILDAKRKIKDVKKNGLFNPMYEMHQKGGGSNAYRDAWSLFDQIIISKALLSKKQSGLFYHKALIYKEPRLLQPEGQYKNYPLRTFSGSEFINGYSDHFPAIVYLLKKV